MVCVPKVASGSGHGSEDGNKHAKTGRIANTTAADVTPEISALATLAACFANIQRGIKRVAQTAAADVTQMVLSEEAESSAGESAAEIATAKAAGANLADLLAQLRQINILRFDYYWQHVQDNMARPQGLGRELEELCALSDYYAALLRGMSPDARKRSGLISDNQAQMLLANVLLNGSLPVTTYCGFPALEDTILWDRWDSEPVSAYKWFKLYLRMQEKFGFRDFAHFQTYLQWGVGGLYSQATRGIYPGAADAACSLSLDGSESGVAESMLSELGMSSSTLASGVLDPSSAVNRQELLRIRAYYHLFYWDLRCSQYDRWERALLQRRGARRTSQLLDAQFTAFEDLFTRVRMRVNESVELLSPNDAIKALQDIAKMLRVNAGFCADKPNTGAISVGFNADRAGIGGVAGGAESANEGLGGFDGEDEFAEEGISDGPQLIINFIRSPYAGTEAPASPTQQKRS